MKNGQLQKPVDLASFAAREIRAEAAKRVQK